VKPEGPVQETRGERFDGADRVIRTGFGLTVFLMVMKLAAGWYGRSEAVFADGLESACDFIAIFSAMVALRIGRKPFDREHPYGHGKAESLAAIAVALVILATGGGIVWKAVHAIWTHALESPAWIAVAAAGVTIVVKEALYRYTVRVGRRLESPSVLAVAKDHRKDAITSLATLAGVTGAFFGCLIHDPLAAVVSAVFIFHIGWQTLRSAMADLMDTTAPRELLERMSTLAAGVAGVARVHEIRGRRSGQYVIVDLKLEMDPQMTVKEAHDIAAAVKRLLFDRFPNLGDVMIHINPRDEEHEDLIRL
jgi:cation diffusion facilitator family transporter